jgi:DNA polymerase-1
MKRFLLIDGNAIIHRAYHAYPTTLTTTKGELVNAVYGFTSILLTVFRDLKPTYVAVTFDLAAPTFRHKKFEGYKASRPAMDEELVVQIDRVKEVVRTLNIPVFEKEGFEADDVIGTLADKVSKGHEKKVGVVIVTGDKDALQLVDNSVKVYLPARGKVKAELVGRAEFIKKYGFEPVRMVDFKALSGDSSDEIPGVSGIGPKTATDLIVRFGDLSSIYNSLDEIKESVRKRLVDDKENAFLSYDLAKIETAVPLNFRLGKCKLADYDKDEVLKLFEALEFRSLIRRLPMDSWEEMVEQTMVYGQEKKEKDKQMELF